MPVKSVRSPRRSQRRKAPADTTPQLPHEHDESARHDAQAPTRVMKGALADVEAGRVDTDGRGDRARAAFDRQPGEAAAPRSRAAVKTKR